MGGSIKHAVLKKPAAFLARKFCATLTRFRDGRSSKRRKTSAFVPKFRLEAKTRYVTVFKNLLIIVKNTPL